MVFFIHYCIAMKPSLILFFIILNHAYAQPGNTGIRLDSWNNAGIYRCPAENDLDIAHLEIASKVNYRLKYCSFEKKFQQSEDKICKQDTHFIFHKKIDVEVCGTTSYQTMHAFSYFTCGGQSDLEKFRDEAYLMNPVSKKLSGFFNYQICYDTVEKKALWTIHSIVTPQIFRNLDNQIQPEMPPISTDPFFMNPNLFSTLKKQYALEKKKNQSETGAFIMVPQPLVPPDHFAAPLTKNSTNHYINMAPLWDNLVPLMKTIDQAILQVQMKSRVEPNDPESFDKLIILTKVVPSKDVDTTLETWFNLLLFQGNIWYKFIYQEKKQAAVMIIIHNTPGKTPDKGCLVGRPKKCEFEKWSKDGLVTSSHTEYAYCCRITAGDIREVFSRSYEIDEYLEIDDLFTEGKILESKL